jgi:hypothetical protein
MTTTPSSFSFNFLPEAVTEQDQRHEDTGERPQDQQQQQLRESGSGESNHSAELSQNRIPFGWLDQDLRPLLAERAQEELVYTELQVTSTSSSLPESTIVESCHSQEEDAAGAVIRCVDLSHSSYLRPSKKTTADSDAEVWKTTDIEPGLYEGGRKVWECSLDLVRYLAEHEISLHRPLGTLTPDQDMTLVDEKNTVRSTTRTFALELGCGHGLPGCYLLRQALQAHPQRKVGMTAVEDDVSSQTDLGFTMVFTDYNESVVLDATLSNIALNCIGTDQSCIDHIVPHILLGAGDWLDMSRQLQQQQQPVSPQLDTMDTTAVDDGSGGWHKLPRHGKFDLILAAETLYSLDAARATAQLLQWHLQPETGVAYIATKRYYFGVNGGIDSFRSAAAAADMAAAASSSHVLDIECVQVMDSGTGNIREILRVRCVAQVV